jgi:hypothetical protein
MPSFQERRSKKSYAAAGNSTQLMGSEGSKYNISSYSYPSDIKNPEEYGDNYVVFFVNVQENSKFASNSNIVVDAIRNPMSIPQIANSNVVKTLLEFANLLDPNAPKEGDGSPKKTSEDASKDTKAAVDGAQASNVKDKTNTTKRITDAVVLHMPTALQVRYSVSYDEIDLTKLTFGLDLIDPNRANSLAGTMAAGAEMKLLNSNDKFKAATNTTINPKTELIFKSVDLRQFSFSYRFAPKNEAEAENVLRIINLFKVHMHPSYKDADGFLYVFPSEFDIQYYSGANENTAVHKHTSCVLTGMTVDYAPNGNFSTFVDGTPSQINMSLEFKELTTLNSGSINDYGF